METPAARISSPEGRVALTEGLVLLLAVLALGLVFGNPLIAGAALALLLLRAADFEALFPWVLKYGFSLGLFIMIFTILTPLAAERIGLARFAGELLSKTGLVTVGVSVVSSLLAREGVDILNERPEILVGLLVGGVIGVLIGGVPNGPLIPAGLIAVALQILR